jgi:O-antigen/teichoic acid export membrane protein
MFNVTLPLLMRKIDGGGKINEIGFSIVAFLKLNIFAWSVISAAVAFNIESIIVYIFDPKYLHTKVYIFTWLFLLYALVIKNVFEPVARALEYTKVYLFTFIAAAVNVIGNYLLIPMFGIEGALIATGFSFTIQGYVSSYIILRKMGIPLNTLKIFGALFRIAVTASVVWHFNVPYGAPISAQLLRNAGLLGVICIIFWPAMLFSADEWKYMRSFVPRLSQ